MACRGRMLTRHCKCTSARNAPHIPLLAFSTIALLCSYNLIHHAIATEGDGEGSSSDGSSAVAVHETADTANTEDVLSSSTQTSDLQTVLLLIKLKPSRSRSKANVVSATKPWKTAEWGASGTWELNVVDNDALVLSSSSKQDALKAKDWLLQQQMVYEVELSGEDGEVFRRPGDVPLEDLRRKLSKQAQEEQRQRGWQWLMRAAKQQGVKLRRPRHRRPARGKGQGRLPGKQEL